MLGYMFTLLGEYSSSDSQGRDAAYLRPVITGDITVGSVTFLESCWEH